MCMFVDENTHPGAHLRVPNHPPSEDLHVHPFGIALHIYYLCIDGGMMDDRLMDGHFVGHFLINKKLLKI